MSQNCGFCDWLNYEIERRAKARNPKATYSEERDAIRAIKRRLAARIARLMDE